MTPPLTPIEISVIGTTGSVFHPLGGSHRGFLGMQITPVYITMNRHVPQDTPQKRGISAAERSARINSNPLRAAAIAKGRQRLAEVHEQLNPNFRPLSSLRLAAGLSQAELAVMMEMKQPNIARLEKKPGDPSLSTLKKLAVALGVDIREVIAAVEVTNTAGAGRV